MTFPDLTALEGGAALEALLRLCIQNGVSDLHFCPQRSAVRTEARIDGLLQTLPELTGVQYEQIVRTIKFAASLKLNVTDAPQDGQYSISGGEGTQRRINVRVAVLPSRFGETVSLRFLDPERGIRSLAALGFPQAMQQQLSELMQLQSGMVLVTGPTGSGKTTTLYGLLSTVIGTARNIVTLEDPVEYEVDGIIQSEIDPEHGFTFETGLRAVLRHGPNIILLGEIRDRQTAQTAIDAALTGHLVLSSLHTNSAIETIPRLLSMGVSPYTFAPALRAVIAQRLVRTLSQASKDQPYDPAATENYSGRTVVPELLVISPALRELILAQAQEGVIAEQAKKEGFQTIRMYGESLVQAGITSKEEVERVTR